jgi:hypothetical protein
MVNIGSNVLIVATKNGMGKVGERCGTIWVADGTLLEH